LRITGEPVITEKISTITNSRVVKRQNLKMMRFTSFFVKRQNNAFYEKISITPKNLFFRETPEK
jgi:hypothetical protein